MSKAFSGASIFPETLERWTSFVQHLLKSVQVKPRLKAGETAQNTDEDKELYRNLIELSNELVHIIDRDGILTFTNTAWKKTLGYTDEEIKGLHVAKIFTEESKEGFLRNMPLVLSGESLSNVSRVLI